MNAVETAFYIEVHQVGRVTVLRLRGALNAVTAEVFAAKVDAAMKNRAFSLVVNLADAGFLDTEGVGALLRARRLVQTGGGTLVLAEAPRQAEQTIKIKGLAIVLLSFQAEGDAIKFLTAPGAC